MELRRTLLRVLLVALALAALAGVVGVVTAAGDTIWRIVGTAIATAVAVGIMLPFSQLMDKQKSRTTGLGGMVWTVVSYVLVLGLLWGFHGFGNRSAEGTGLTLLCWSLCGLPAVLLLRLTSVPEARIAGLTGVWTATAAFVLLMIWVWEETFYGWSSSNEKWTGQRLHHGHAGHRRRRESCPMPARTTNAGGDGWASRLRAQHTWLPWSASGREPTRPSAGRC